VNAVRDLFIADGHAVEEIERDYGEDLLVQTSLRGLVDPCRLWVQVKGTEVMARHRRGDDYAVRVSPQHVKKWISITDLMVVVLWDVVERRGFWTLPRRELGWAAESPRGSHDLRLPLPQSQRLDAAAVNRLVWEARFESYATRIAQIIVAESFNPVKATADFPQAFMIPEWSRHLVMIDLLEDMRVIDADGLRAPYATLWRNAWNAGAHVHDALERHVTASTRMFEKAIDDVAPGVRYLPHLLTAVLLMLASQIRPGRTLDVAGCDWQGVTDASFDGENGPLSLFDHSRLGPAART
jgi:hypothetical protein